MAVAVASLTLGTVANPASASENHRWVTSPYGEFAYAQPTTDSPAVRLYYSGEMTGEVLESVIGQTYEGNPFWVKLPVNETGMTAYLWTGGLTDNSLDLIPPGSTAEQWNTLGACESGNRYNAKNGQYLGRWQIGPIWDHFEGHSNALEASPQSQDRKAHQLFIKYGWSQWDCSPFTGKPRSR